MRITRKQDDKPDRTRRSRNANLPAEPVKMIVSGGQIIGWERGGEFVPIGENCCANPFECKKCFGPVEPRRSRLWR